MSVIMGALLYSISVNFRHSKVETLMYVLAFCSAIFLLFNNAFSITYIYGINTELAFKLFALATLPVLIISYIFN